MDSESPCASPEPILCSDNLEMEEEVCVFSENEDSISNVSPASRDYICIGGGSDEDDIETEVEDEEEEDEEMGVPSKDADENKLLHQTHPLDNPVKSVISDCTVSRFPQEEEDETMESWCDYSDSESE